MKVLLGISRYLVGPNGACQLQRPEDIWEIHVPEDGTEFLGRIWMRMAGFDVLNLPLITTPEIAFEAGFIVEAEDDD